MEKNYLDSARKQFEYYKMLGEKTFDQMPDEALFWQYNADSNSIAIIVKHLWGNMLSRWTDFLSTDGEKAWRNREAEFDADIADRAELLAKWEEGWTAVFGAIDSVNEENFGTTIYIRNIGHTVIEAVNRQMAHYAHHIGQIVFIGKMAKGEEWTSLSIPRGKSAEYNAAKFAKPKHRGHFTDEFLGKNEE